MGAHRPPIEYVAQLLQPSEALTVRSSTGIDRLDGSQRKSSSSSSCRRNRQSLSLASYPGDIFNTREDASLAQRYIPETAIVDDAAEEAAFGGAGQLRHDARVAESLSWFYTNDMDQTPRANDQDQFSLNAADAFMHFANQAPKAHIPHDALNHTGLLSPQVSRQNSNTNSAAQEAREIHSGMLMLPSVQRQYMNVQGDYRAIELPEESIMPGLLMGSDARVQANTRQTSSNGRIVARLLAPTSMRRSQDEDTQTYLNKSQLYGLSLLDTEYQPQDRQVRYRTTVKVLFHDEDQKQRANAFWSIWRDGRGMSEAIERKAMCVRALEFDEAGPVKMMEKHKAEVIARPVLVFEASDGFTVDWSPVPQSPQSQTMLALRCHFLSTDFSHSKGVRGVSLKLAVRTEIFPAGTENLTSGSACLIKLFRDKGAERKASNDLSHVRKALQRLEDPQNAAHSGTGSSGVMQKAHARRESSDFQMRVQQRRKRSTSVSSQSSGNASQSESFSRQDEIAMYRAMLASVDAVTLLQLPLEADDNMTLNVEDDVSLRTLRLPEAVNAEDGAVKTEKQSPQAMYCPAFRTSPRPVLLPNQRTILSVDVDEHYELQKPQKRPVRCIYIKHQMDHDTMSQQILSPVSDGSPSLTTHASARAKNIMKGPIYRAIYLFDFSVNAFVSAVAKKLGLDLEQHPIARCVRENDRGIRILLEDEMLERMPDGQDVIIRMQDFGQGQLELILRYTSL